MITYYRCNCVIGNVIREVQILLDNKDLFVKN